MLHRRLELDLIYISNDENIQPIAYFKFSPALIFDSFTFYTIFVCSLNPIISSLQ